MNVDIMSYVSVICSYGFSRARYVYSLISGVGIFFLGAGVTVYHGAMGLFHPPMLEFLPAVGIRVELITSYLVVDIETVLYTESCVSVI